MIVPKGLYEVLTSKNLTIEKKVEAIERFSWPIYHLDGPDAGKTESGPITSEDAQLIITALKEGRVYESEPGDMPSQSDSL